MKTNDRYEDAALREVVTRQTEEKEHTALPDNFANSVMQRIQHEQQTADIERPTIVHPTRYRKVAAVAAIALLVCGLSYAAWEYIIGSPQPPVENRAESAALPDSVVNFSNVRLDSILYRVGRTYDYAVRFDVEELREWRFQITWNPGKPLTEFVQLLNEFDGLNVAERNDTLFVNIQDMGEE